MSEMSSYERYKQVRDSTKCDPASDEEPDNLDELNLEFDEVDWRLDLLATELITESEILEIFLRRRYNEREEEKKIRVAVDKSDIESANLHAENIVLARSCPSLASRMRKIASEAESAAKLGYILENARDTCADLFFAITDFKLRKVLTVIQKLQEQLRSLGVSSSAGEDASGVVTELTTTLQEQVDALIGQVTDRSRSN